MKITQQSQGFGKFIALNQSKRVFHDLIIRKQHSLGYNLVDETRVDLSP